MEATSAGHLRGNGNVLVVEDDADTRQLLGCVLLGEGIEHELAATGLEAIQASLEHPPRMVLLDVHLPRLDGMLVAQALRSELGPKLPILATSASDERDTASRFGAYGFVPKPFDLDQLVRLIRQGLDLAERSRQLQLRSQRALHRLVLVTERQNTMVQAAALGSTRDRRLVDLLNDAEFLLVQLVTLHRSSGPHRIRQEAQRLGDLHRRLDKVERELRVRGSESGLDAQLTLGELRRQLRQMSDRRASSAPYADPAANRRPGSAWRRNRPG